MVSSLCLLLFLNPLMDDEVKVSDVDRFKASKWECEQQLERNREWLLYLEYMSLIHGRTDEIEGWKRTTKWFITYWHLLYESHEAWMIGDEWRLAQLERLKNHIGDYRYKKGWTPMRFPADLPKAPKAPVQSKGTPA